jgi:hypothetical protein
MAHVHSGLFFEHTLAANQEQVKTPEFVAKQGATSVVFFCFATGDADFEVMRIDEAGTERSTSRGTPIAVAGGSEEAISFAYHLPRAVIRIADRSGAENAVRIEVHQGGV